MAVLSIQPPIIKAAKRGGANLETNDNPIGLRHNSPTVITPYVPMSHHALTFSEPFNPTLTAAIITVVDNAVMISPQNILPGVLGSNPFLRANKKNPTTSGVKITTKNGLMDWNNSVESNCAFSPSRGSLSAGIFLK